MSSFRFRFTEVGVAALVAAAAITVVGIVQSVGAASASSVFVPITPCRLADTRPGLDNVGSRTAPLGVGDTATFQVTGANGNCSIPDGATGIAANVTVARATASSYLTIFPADAARPLSANLVWEAGAPPTPNQVTVGLSSTGAIKAYNLNGQVDLVIDVVGYYHAAAAGAAGPAGPQGPAGAQGLSAWDTIPAGVTVTGEVRFDSHSPGDSIGDEAYIALPAIAPVALDDAHVHLSTADPAHCTGTSGSPAAAPGHLCVYVYLSGNVTNLAAGIGDLALRSRGAHITFFTAGLAGDDTFVFATWAYRAPLS